MSEKFGGLTNTPLDPNAFGGSEITVWQPNTYYKEGDIVLSQYTDLEKNKTFMVLMECIVEHQSTNIGLPGLTDVQYWQVTRIVADEAYKATYDILKNPIHTTYATKKELGDINSILETLVEVE